MREDETNAPRQSKARSGNCDKSSDTKIRSSVAKTVGTSPISGMSKTKPSPKRNSPATAIQGKIPVNFVGTPQKLFTDEGILQTVVNKEQPSKPQFRKGDLVSVKPRTWPGINKLGGKGKVTKVTTMPDGTPAYNVKYVVGNCTDTEVEAKYVQPWDMYENDIYERDCVTQCGGVGIPRAAKRKANVDDDASLGVDNKKKKRLEEESNLQNAAKVVDQVSEDNHVKQKGDGGENNVHKSAGTKGGAKNTTGKVKPKKKKLTNAKTKMQPSKRNGKTTAKTEEVQEVVDFDFSKCITYKPPRDKNELPGRRRGWVNKECCGPGCKKKTITDVDFYYGVEGSNEAWKLVILCSECCLEVEKDCVGKDLERDKNKEVYCRGKVVECKLLCGNMTETKEMSLSDFNKLERK